MPKHGPWTIAVAAIQDVSSAIVGVRVLWEPPESRNAMWELDSIRATMGEDGTGDLATMAIADGPVPVGNGNTDSALMTLRNTSPIGGAANPNVYWHWGRSNQIGVGPGTNDTLKFPPEFWWDGELWGIQQNGSGASPVSLFTVIYRTATFSRQEFLALKGRVLPGSASKISILTS